MSHESSKLIVHTAYDYLRKELKWPQDEALTAMEFISDLIVVLEVNKFPVHNEKFPEIVRVLANMIEATIEQVKKEAGK